MRACGLSVEEIVVSWVKSTWQCSLIYFFLQWKLSWGVFHSLSWLRIIYMVNFERSLLKSSYRFIFWSFGSVRILGVMRFLGFVCLGILSILATLHQVKSHGNHPFSKIAIRKTTFALNENANVKASPSILGLKASSNPLCFVLISWTIIFLTLQEFQKLTFISS